MIPLHTVTWTIFSTFKYGDRIVDKSSIVNSKIAHPSSRKHNGRYVLLTTTQNYFDSITNNTYGNFFINDAEVKVWTTNLDGYTDTINLTLIVDSIPFFTDVECFNFFWTFLIFEVMNIISFIIMNDIDIIAKKWAKGTCNFFSIYLLHIAYLYIHSTL